MSKFGSKMRVLTLFYIVEGVFYLAYSVWRTTINPLTFYRAPPLLGVLAKVFLYIMLVTGIFFLYRGYNFLTGQVKLSNTDLIASLCSMALWGFPALLAFGNAQTYLSSPYISEELRPMGFYYLQVGIVFVAVGVINLLSVVYLIFYKTVSEGSP